MNSSETKAYMLNEGEGFSAIDLRSGMVRSVSGSGPKVEDMAALALDESQDRLLVADRAQSALVAMELATGEREILDRIASRVDGALFEPEEVAIVNDGEAVVLSGTPDKTPDSADDRVLVLQSFEKGTITELARFRLPEDARLE